MTRKNLRQFAQQFGKEWLCSCKTPFGLANLDIISESENSLVAHYICPNCGREQMLAASISSDKQINDDVFSVNGSVLSADDVLDIRDEIREMKQASLRGMHRSKTRRQHLKQPST